VLLQDGFLTFPVAPMTGRVSEPSHLYNNYQVNAQSTNPFMFRDNSYTYMIILSRSMVKHICKII